MAQTEGFGGRPRSSIADRKDKRSGAATSRPIRASGRLGAANGPPPHSRTTGRPGPRSLPAGGTREAAGRALSAAALCPHVARQRPPSTGRVTATLGGENGRRGVEALTPMPPIPRWSESACAWGGLAPAGPGAPPEEGACRRPGARTRDPPRRPAPKPALCFAPRRAPSLARSPGLSRSMQKARVKLRAAKKLQKAHVMADKYQPSQKPATKIKRCRNE